MSNEQTKENKSGVRSRAARLCFEWLKWCLDNGWPKTSLDDLQKLWWKYHDENGDLVE